MATTRRSPTSAPSSRRGCSFVRESELWDWLGAHGLRDVWMGSAMVPPAAASRGEDLFALVLPGAANAGGSLVFTRTQLED